VDVPRFAAFLKDHGCQFTQAWLLDAWAIGEQQAGRFKPGQYDGFLPWIRLPDGRFDLDQPNAEYYDHLRTYVDTMNQHGMFVELSVLELYTWSARKDRLPFVPNRNLQPVRRNVNVVLWGDPDDDATFSALPDAVVRNLLHHVMDALDGTSYCLKVGNEFPEKRANLDTVTLIRDLGFSGDVIINRQEDTPGQYWNMGVGVRCDLLELHGRLSLDYLDEDFPDEADADRPRTFRAMWDLVNPARVILSSDGGGGNPDLQPDLLLVARDALARGASYEHQLALKRNRFYGDGALRMDDLALDSAFLKDIRR